MQKTLIIVLIVVIVALSGVMIWQNLPKNTSLVEKSPIENNTPNANNQPAVNKPVVNNQPKLTLSILNNAEYYSGSVLPGQRIKLVNGTYTAKPPIEDITKLEANYTAYGDLNNDGQEDAVVVLATSGGGTGLFRELEAVLNQSGKAFNIAMQDLGDRPTINSIAIESGVIIVDMSPKSETRKIVKYKLSGDKLQEIN